MEQIKVVKNPSPEELEQLDVSNWPIWKKEVSEFPWYYDCEEVCYILEGDVVVTSDDGEPVRVGKGDLVTFPEGMACRWKIEKDIKKHYTFR